MKRGMKGSLVVSRRVERGLVREWEGKEGDDVGQERELRWVRRVGVT